MNPERWKRVEQVYHSALARSPEGRAAVLDESCSGDPDLRREVESLLDAQAEAGSFLSPEGLYDHIAELGSQPAASVAGSTLGPYRIVVEIGAGSMGEVYRALDTRLDRQVALKILPAHFTHDAGRVARFRLEAKAASGLNHPNIVTIYEIGQTAGTWFIAQELIEGVTLRERLAAGKLPLHEALGIAIQCAMALETAHQAGILHRDIKPENVMLRPDGVVKIVDFGLARISESGPEWAIEATQAGSVIGTPRYMSPEQARGQKLDARSDIFSLGAVLFEIVAGRPAFPGATPAEVFAALLDSQPVFPDARVLRATLAKTLAKDRDSRYQTMDEFANDLRRIDPRQEKVTGRLGLQLLLPFGRLATKKVGRIRRSHAGMLVTALLLVACLVTLWYRWTPPRESARDAQFTLVPLTAFAGPKDYPAFSPDGSRVAFSWNGDQEGVLTRHIYMKPLAGEPVQLTSAAADDTWPAWSPDGRSLAFLRRLPGSEFAVYIIPSAGGPERKLAAEGAGVSWSPDGKWLALAHAAAPKGSGSLFLLSLQTGERRELTAPQNASDAFPVYSPNGQWIAFMRRRLDRDVFVIPASGGPARQLTFDSKPKLGLTWTADNREIVYSALREYGGAGLWRVGIRGGEPRRLASTLDFAGNPNISRAGDRLAYTESWIDSNIYGSEGSGFTASGVPGQFGGPQKVIASSREDHSPSFSADGERIAFVSNRTGHSEIWTSRRDGSRQMQLTHFNSFAGTPRWSPDGRWIAFDCVLGGSEDIWVISAAGGAPRRLTATPAPNTKPSWAPDGTWIYFNSNRSGTDQVWKMRADGNAPTQLTWHGGREPLPSSDGRTIYYTKLVGPAPIWTVPAGGGQEKPLAGMEAFDHIGRVWGVLKEGIYFVSAEAGGRREMVRFFSFKTRRVTSLRVWQETAIWAGPAVALSPDGRHLLTVQTDQRVNDLMMIENFR